MGVKAGSDPMITSDPTSFLLPGFWRLHHAWTWMFMIMVLAALAVGQFRLSGVLVTVVGVAVFAFCAMRVFRAAIVIDRRSRIVEIPSVLGVLRRRLRDVSAVELADHWFWARNVWVIRIRRGHGAFPVIVFIPRSMAIVRPSARGAPVAVNDRWVWALLTHFVESGVAVNWNDAPFSLGDPAQTS